MKLLAIIPARGGSKGIPGKNLVKIKGRSLVIRALDAASSSTSVTDIIISTDNDLIATECEESGIEVPFIRPVELASDEAGMLDVVLHSMDMFEKDNNVSSYMVVVLQPTSPFRKPCDIDKCFQMLAEQDAQSIVSVHKVKESPYECLRKDQSGNHMIVQSNGPLRRQDYLEKFYFINGVIYMAHNNFIRKEKALFKESESILFEMDALRGLDIDNEDDLVLAQALASHSTFMNKCN